jgi:hypothetical protein
MSAILDLLPSWVPDGYKLLRRVEGKLFEGFPGEAPQTILVYGRGWRDADAYRPLLVYLATPNHEPVLFGTGEHEGALAGIDADHTAAYHDGRWELGSGDDEQRTPSGAFVYWSNIEWHSLTAVLDDGLLAVRGSRANGVDVEQLVGVVRSLLAQMAAVNG